MSQKQFEECGGDKSIDNKAWSEQLIDRTKPLRPPILLPNGQSEMLLSCDYFDYWVKDCSFTNIPSSDISGVLPFARGVADVFYNPSQQCRRLIVEFYHQMSFIHTCLLMIECIK